MANVPNLEVNQDKAMQYSVIKDEIDMVMCIVYSYAVLSADECKALTKFEQE
jgi:hypothetical protein